MLNKLQNHVHEIQNGRPVAILFFQLTRVQVHIFPGINLVFCIQVYQYQALYKHDNCHDQIQNGRPAAILVTSMMKIRLKKKKNSNRFNIVQKGCS